MSIDASFFQAIFGLAHQSAPLDFFGVFFAQYLPYILMLVFLLWLFFERDWRRRFYNFALTALAVIAARGLLVELFRFIYFRSRPELMLSIAPLIGTPDAPAFPSGHAATFFALAAAVYLVKKRTGIWFLAAAALISLGRVFVGVHWPSDVLAGALIGILSALAVYSILPKKISAKS